MAKPTRPTKSRTVRVSSHKANALGYAKRQSLKSKSKDVSTSDIYEYTPEKTRRSKIKLDLGREEVAEFGREDDEETDERRARLIGEDGEDEMIASDDDEEIDSDAAFEESDEERFAGSGLKTLVKKKTVVKKHPTVHFADVDLNEEAADVAEDVSDEDGMGSDDSEDEMEEEGEPEDFIDVLDVLDGKGEVDDEIHVEAEKAQHDGRARTFEDEDDEDSDEGKVESDHDDDDEKMPLSPSYAEVEDDAHAALAELESFISKLDPGKKRKAEDGDTQPEAQPTRKRRTMIKERTGAGVENEFSAQSSGTKLNLTDLLAPLSSHSSSLLSLKKSTKVLSSSSAKALSAPLPQRTQERLDREAAYEQTKEEVDKWSATMKRIKEAEHLSFPLQTQPEGKVSNLELTAKFKPTTDLESSIDKLLKSAKMREEDIEKTESLKMNHLSVEEVAARRGELRKMRELMFRAEVKAKRVSKIKSKAYRRIQKREKEKIAVKLGDGDDDEDEQGRMKREVERAKERATLRHKNTGKWAKAMKARGELNGDERREIGEMLERGEKLRRKIRGLGSDDEEEEESETDGDDDDEERLEKIKKGAFDELEMLDTEGKKTPQSEDRKALFEMKFMKNALAREKEKTDHLVDDFRKELGSEPNETSDTEELNEGSEKVSDGVTVHRTGGRVTYRPGETYLQAGRTSPRPNTLQSEGSSITLKSTDLSPPSPVPRPVERTAAAPISKTSNPWLAPLESTIKAPRKKNEIIVDKDSANIDKSKNKLKKQTKKHAEEKEKEKEDAIVEISVDDAMTISAPSTSKQRTGAVEKETSTKKTNPSRTPAEAADDDSDVNSEVEEQENALTLKGKGKASGIKAFEQRDLVALAFAGDNVVESFQEEKRREVEEDAPKEVDTTLPGWGSWGGTGARKQKPKPHLIKKIAGVDPKTRADYNKAHVIISEKRDKKASKYLVKDLPYPYTSKAQFERSMETPIGTEWNTRVGFQRGTLPKVVKKMGTVINPLEKLF